MVRSSLSWSNDDDRQRIVELVIEEEGGHDFDWDFHHDSSADPHSLNLAFWLAGQNSFILVLYPYQYSSESAFRTALKKELKWFRTMAPLGLVGSESLRCYTARRIMVERLGISYRDLSYDDYSILYNSESGDGRGLQFVIEGNDLDTKNHALADAFADEYGEDELYTFAGVSIIFLRVFEGSSLSSGAFTDFWIRFPDEEALRWLLKRMQALEVSSVDAVLPGLESAVESGSGRL